MLVAFRLLPAQQILFWRSDKEVMRYSGYRIAPLHPAGNSCIGN